MIPVNAVKSVAVIGNGLMGQGISQVFARAGKTVHLIDRNPAIVLGSTSGQPVSLMTGRMRNPERAVAMHFIYPAQLIPVVEVCGGPDAGADEQGG